MNVFPVLTDGVVELRAPEASDADALIAEQDDLVVQWLTGQQLSQDEAVEWIASVRECWSSRRHRRNFAIIECASEHLIGGIEAHTDSNLVEGIEPGEANIGCWIGPSGRGKGYAGRSVALVTQYLAVQGVLRARIRTRHDNVSANRAAQRAGFTQLTSVPDELARWDLDLTQFLEV